MIAEISTRPMVPTVTHAKYKPSIALRNVRAIADSLSSDLELIATPDDMRRGRGMGTRRDASPWPLSGGLNALDRFSVFGAVFIPHRLHGVLERLLVGELHDLHAGGLGLGQGLLLVLGPQHALFRLRLARELHQQHLVVFRQRAPD